MPRRPTLILAMLLLLSACTGTSATPSFLIQLPSPTGDLATPTQPPPPTQTAVPPTETFTPPLPTGTAPGPSPTPSETFVPLPTLAVQTVLPTALPQPEAGTGRIQIYSPGPMSKLVSPFYFYGYAIPGYGSRGRIELFGEDGRLLDSSNLWLTTAYTWAYFNGSLEFQAQGAGELGRLSLSTQDEYGRTTALASVRVLLLPQGYSVVNPAGKLSERCVLIQPVTNQRLSGGSLSVEGEMRPLNSLPLEIELLDVHGERLAYGLVAVSPAADDRFVSFQVVLEYDIPVSTQALLVVRQADERIGGTMYLYSREIYLSP